MIINYFDKSMMYKKTPDESSGVFFIKVYSQRYSAFLVVVFLAATFFSALGAASALTLGAAFTFSLAGLAATAFDLRGRLLP